MAADKASLKLQAQVDATTRHVLDNLVGVRGRSLSDVIYFVIRQWISEHREELAQMGIRIQVPAGVLEVTDRIRGEQ